MAGLIVIGILFGIFAGTLVALVADERENLPKFIPLMFLISFVFIFLVCISPYNLEDKTEIYQLQKNVDGDYYKEIGNRITVTCKNYETGMNFPNDIVTFQETDSNPEIKIDGNVKKTGASDDDKYGFYSINKVTIFIPKDNKDECSTTKKCENCGAENAIDAKYCEQCGEKFENAQE